MWRNIKIIFMKILHLATVKTCDFRAIFVVLKLNSCFLHNNRPYQKGAKNDFENTNIIFNVIKVHPFNTKDSGLITKICQSIE